MAARRTGTIFSAEELRRKRRPIAFQNGGIRKVLRTIGKPIYWVILGIVFLLGFLALAVRHLVLSFRFPKIRLPRISLPAPRIPSRALFLTLLLLFFLFGLSLLARNFLFGLPDPNRLLTRQPALTTKIYDRNGQLLYKIYRRENRTLVELKDIPFHLIQAVIATEDAEFFQHRGFSPKAIFRAILGGLNDGKLTGGSTITQQLVKNTLLTPERTWRRKTKEIILALMVEARFSKSQILQMYLNEVGFGGSAYGVEEAAQLYFGESVKNLDLAESALLAGLPASPTTYSPLGANPEKALGRQKLVLRRMAQEKYISAEEEERAANEELHFAPQKIDIKAPHFVMYTKELLAEKYGDQMVEEGGLEVKTSLDLGLQEAAQEIVRREVEKLNGLHITNGAALITNPRTGEILAMVGSRDYFDLANDGNVNVTTRPRQPGSSIKPVNYSLALENGFTAATILADTPITYLIAGQPPYSPTNYDKRFHGNVPLRVALGSSYNVPAVKVLASLGVERMIKRGQDLGITTWDDPSRFGLSLTLGGGEVKMIDLAAAYGAFASTGVKMGTNPILEVKDNRGKVLEANPCAIKTGFETCLGTQAVSGGVAFIISDILSDINARIPAFGARSWLNIANHPRVAVKTGTTQNLRDNWTIGYTPDRLAAVWVGNNDNTPMSYVASGVTGASPIWNKIMTLLLKDIPDKEFPRPKDLKQVAICAATATLPCEGCPSVKREWFLPGTAPKTACDPQQFVTTGENKDKLLEGISTQAQP